MGAQMRMYVVHSEYEVLVGLSEKSSSQRYGRQPVVLQLRVGVWECSPRKFWKNLFIWHLELLE